ncbi:leucine-rich repeat, cysteine-containing subtype protein [Tanacetum coccineum]
MVLTKMGEEVLDLVIPYIHDVEDRNSVSLVSRPPFHFTCAYHNHIRITPWIEQLALEFRFLKELHIRGLVVHDEDLEHVLALNSNVLEIFKFKNRNISHADAEDLTLLAKNCCNLLISLKIGKCYLSKLGDAFRYAVRLEHFSGENLDKESDLVGFL